MADDKIDALKSWFQENKRDFPWRKKTTPYGVWVSEVMLQQTRASVVVPYYLRWMDRFPTIEALAAAEEAAVIKLWEGLGYYSRARSLHQGARYLVMHHRGTLPSSYKELAQVKGIGPYTIGAIRSFAFQQKEPAVDGNVIRVMTRFLALQDDISKPKTVKKIREEVARFLPEKESWVVSEALIELGATLCVKKPDCKKCPLRDECKALLHSLQEEIPFSSKKIKIENLDRTVCVLLSKDFFLVQKIDEGQVMSGLHEFFSLEGWLDEEELVLRLEEHLSCRILATDPLTEQKHTYTRYRVRLRPYQLQIEERREIPGFTWYPKKRLIELAFSSGHRRILREVLKRSSKGPL